MINYAVIGTSMISGQFIKSAQATNEWDLTVLYSRSVEKADHFLTAEELAVVPIETNWTAFLADDRFSTVYIASPNSIHFQQAIALLQAKKNIVVEKPIFPTAAEVITAQKVAKENGVFIFEAARHIHEENFKVVKNLLVNGPEIEGATFAYSKYSSRYDQVLNGEEPNIFTTKFAGGALVDLGIYLVYSAVAWFGAPDKAHYFAKKISTGVDGSGTIILQYPTFNVTLLTGKIIQSYLPSEIYTNSTTIKLDAVNAITDIAVWHRETNTETQHAVAAPELLLYDEARAFASVINHPTDEQVLARYAYWSELSLQVTTLIEQLRQDAGIIYDAEK